jgi:hypothetical protein
MLNKLTHYRQMTPTVWTLLILTGTLFFVYTLPHAMALRKLLLFTAFFFSAKAFIDAFQ